MNGLLDVEGQSKRLIVFGPYSNRVLVANDVDVLCFDRKANRIGEQPEAILDLLIRSASGKPALLTHRITEPIIVEQVLSGIHAEVDDTDKKAEPYHAAEPARSPNGGRSTIHHCDCAP